MSHSGPGVLLTRDGGVAWVRLNRPEKRNAFDLPTLLAFSEALREAEDDSDTRCVVVTGTGVVFSAGADINRLKAVVDPEEVGAYIREHWEPVFRRLRTMPKPVICGLNGVASGIAASVAMACDLRIAASSAALVEAFARVGLGPDGGASWMLPRLAGRGKALEMFFLAKPLEAVEAERLGVFNRVVPAEDLETACAEVAQALVRAPSSALAAAKRAVNYAETSSFDAAFEFESQLQAVCASTAAFQEGLSAFLQKRKPDFLAAEGTSHPRR